MRFVERGHCVSDRMWSAEGQGLGHRNGGKRGENREEEREGRKGRKGEKGKR